MCHWNSEQMHSLIKNIMTTNMHVIQGFARRIHSEFDVLFFSTMMESFELCSNNYFFFKCVPLILIPHTSKHIRFLFSNAPF